MTNQAKQARKAIQTGGILFKGVQTHNVKHKDPKLDRKRWKEKRQEW